MRRAKIVATIGPSSESEEKLDELFRAGVNVARINMSHGTRERHSQAMDRIRRISGRMGVPAAILLDLSGPKIRTGRLRRPPVLLEEGSEVRVTGEDLEGDSRCISSNYGSLAGEVRPGDRLLISDGAIVLEVTRSADSEVVTRVLTGGLLAERQGINLPGTRISMPSVTDKDVGDLKFGIEMGIDLVALSFVRVAADCIRTRDLMRGFGSQARLIAKIEKPEAVEDLDNILDASDGVMVARGDLAVETSPETVPVLQKRIIARARQAEKAVITATQMLQSMIENPQPTRAEASDVANAILDGSDALMLSGETAVGRYPVEAVKMMDRIIRSSEDMNLSSGTHNDSVSGPSLLSRQTGSYGRAIAEAARYAAAEVDCRSIVVFTKSGHMARCISTLRPRQRIIALTLTEQTRRQLALSWGVQPCKMGRPSDLSDEVLASGDRTLQSLGLAEPGEIVVVMAGQLGDAAISYSMKLHRVGGALPAGASGLEGPSGQLK